MNYAILLSGGVGQRLGSNIPKQYIDCCGKPIIFYSLSALFLNSNVDKMVIVAADDWIPLIKVELAKFDSDKEILFASAGETRQLSIFNGLEKIDQKFEIHEDDIVIVHDAARPLVSQDLIDSCMVFEEEYDGVMPALPVKDTIYVSEDGRCISQLLNRATLFAGQAPESFRLMKYYQAHSLLSWEELLKINGSSELAFRAGMKIKMVKGDIMNFKITDSQDLENFKQLIK